MTAAPSAPDTPEAPADAGEDDLTLPSPRRAQADPVASFAPAPPAGLRTPSIDGLYARPAPTGRTSRLATVALIAGGLLPPLGILLGIVALRRLRDRGDRGRGFAIWGIALGAAISLLIALGVALSALHALGSASASGPSGASAPGGSEAVSQLCSGDVCTVTARGAPVTVEGIGVDGTDGVTVLAIGEGTAAVASREGSLEVPTGTALVLQRGTEVVLTQADADTVVLVYQR